MNGSRTKACDCFRVTCSQSRVSNRFRRFTTQRVPELARPEASAYGVRCHFQNYLGSSVHLVILPDSVRSRQSVGDFRSFMRSPDNSFGGGVRFFSALFGHSSPKVSKTPDKVQSNTALKHPQHFRLIFA
jgi:hypothetical protein